MCFLASINSYSVFFSYSILSITCISYRYILLLLKANAVITDNQHCTASKITVAVVCVYPCVSYTSTKAFECA